MELSTRTLTRALEAGDLVFHYQPKVSFVTGRIEGAEALIRWRLPDGTLLPPSEFIPFAEARGLSTPIARGMFPRLMADLECIRAEQGDACLAFNLSARDLEDPALLAQVHDAIASSRIAGRHLEVEVTEGMAIAREEALVERLRGLLADGVHLAMDDYGIGFSSLDTLNRLPFSVLKLDQSFVMQMLASPKSATLVKTSIAMAQLLGIRTVVEGIESEEVYTALLHYGCTEAQGYWISPPVALDGYLALCRSDRRWPCSPVGMLRMAQLTHGWQYKLLVDALFAYLRDPGAVGSVPDYLHMDHTECALGRWYYGEGRRLAGQPDYDALEAPHRRMHGICGEIMALVSAPQRREAIVTLVKALGDESCHLSSRLQRLETRLLFEEL